ncbi:MAG: hypothetical protein HZR80_05265 [Candidatus Heimdallarchaeota archaeon]
MNYVSELGTFSITIKKRIISLSIPILISAILSSISSFIIFGYFFTPFGGGEGPPSGTFPGGGLFGNIVYNVLFYVGIAFIGATGIFLIYKYGSMKALKALFATAISITTFFFVFLLIYTTPYYFLNVFKEGSEFSSTTQWIIITVGIVVGLGYTAVTLLSMVYQIIPHPWPQIMALLFAVLAGTFLSVFLPTLIAVFVMIGLSIYDIISVFRGPIKKIAEISEERYLKEKNELENGENPTKDTPEERPAINETVNMEQESKTLTELPERTIASEEAQYVYVDYIELGLGDLAFFGMIVSFALIRLGFFAAIGALVGVIIGSIITIKLLEKVKMMPGLPLSIGLGLALAFGVWGITLLTGYEGWGWNMPDWFGIGQ